MATRRSTPEEERRGSTGGHKGGEAALHSAKVSAAEIQLYLKGINYPASKIDIVNKGKANGAPSSVMDFFNRMPEKQYGGPTVVEQEFSKLK